MKCKQCGKEFNALRKTQKYCARDCQLKGLAQESKAGVAQDNDVAQEIVAIAQENTNLSDLEQNSAAYTPQGCTQSQETISDIPFNSGDILPLDLTIHDFNYDVNKYQSYVINRNKQTRDCIAATPLDVLKQSGQFIPAWRYAIG
jgi:hypothetical protein